MSERRQEKLGWIVGWLGGFVWVAILGVVFLVQGRWTAGAIGLAIAAAAGLAIPLLGPWRHPRVRYRALMAPVYLLFFGAVAWGVLALGDPRRMGFHTGWSLLLLLPLLIPFWTVGGRRWIDGDR